MKVYLTQFVKKITNPERNPRLFPSEQERCGAEQAVAEPVHAGSCAGARPESFHLPVGRAKAHYVRSMFACIASRYDLLNTILSFNQHHAWRRLTVKLLRVQPGQLCLDVCTGTGDFAIELARATGAQGRVIGADFCEPMIRSGQSKVRRQTGGVVRMTVADAECLPYASGLFDVVTVGFGVRNVVDLEKAVAEMVRVVKPGGRVGILEFNRPPAVWYRPFVDFYLFQVLPRVGGLFGRRDAYTYLPESMKSFVSREELAACMTRAGLDDIQIYDLNFGTVCIHTGVKRMEPRL
ncbi:MAG: bifunctional demethylmenaquinone methyltransferase/2-methoxy-6-polyprenyl-1,4-benzoquinol methylase UbiE [Chloroherpetonaceae bacterium]|nr:bifunctional demethylmenaquinone methyltransferase/2-methoxy-6-polyprenyl-1,4-benzoquinol methylase UbiE [Chthonomonadaceae bacterium]MDW8208246.1 bifunctional demethylmenaquinone methyltransferase/2-methoxy-6-polyprenyl-1,4-benzoquinol methylase UbiE [Chloroherpetonaceae bacterium]